MNQSNRQDRALGRAPAREASFDVVIIGGGVLGTAAAARLSQTNATVCLLDAESDVCQGASKGNAGNAVSYYGPPGRLQTTLINASSPRWEDLCRSLDVPYERIGSLMVAMTPDEVVTLQETLEEIQACGVQAELLTRRQTLEAEPLVSEKCLGALSIPSDGIIDPMRLTVGYAQLAAANGVTVRLSERLVAAQPTAAGTSLITTSGTIHARYVINAAGLGAGLVSDLLGGLPIRMWPRKGQYVVVDREFGKQLSRIVFCTHSPQGKGVNVNKTTHGTALFGPTATDETDPDDKSTDASTIRMLVEQCSMLVPSARDAYPIKTFAANRPASEEQFRYALDPHVPNLLHLIDRSTGVSVSPAAADLALALLNEAGLDAEDLTVKARSIPTVPRLRSATDPQGLLALDPLYGQVVCACEHVSAAEIAAALDGEVPARSVEGLKMRTKAGYGRCQGSTCMAGLTFMVAQRTGSGPSSTSQTIRGSVAP